MESCLLQLCKRTVQVDKCDLVAVRAFTHTQRLILDKK